MKLIDFIVNYMDMFTLAFFFDNVFTKKARKLDAFQYWMVFIGSYSCAIFLDALPFMKGYESFTIIVLTIGLLFVYRIKLLWQLGIAFLYQGIAMLSEVLTYGLFRIVFDRAVVIGRNEVWDSVMLLSAKIITLMLVIVVSLVKKQHNEDTIPGRQYQIILLFIAGLSIAAILSQVDAKGETLVRESAYPIYLTSFVLLAINLLIYKLIDYIVDSTRERHDREKLELLMGMQQVRYNEISSHFVQMNQFIHDTNKHMRYVAYCINEREYEKAKQYIDDWGERLRDQYKQFDTGNLAVDAMLSSCMQQASEANIQVQTDIRIQRNVNIENYDICVVLGNLLDNALEEVRKISGPNRRYVKISSYTNDYGIIFEIINPLEDGERPDFSQTSKRNKLKHGYGMKNIQRILEDYGGNLRITIEHGCIKVAAYMPFRKELE